jgi:rhamnose utilization protein RhaD (predicted bifunctional aldolase and dehydrogenase)
MRTIQTSGFVEVRFDQVLSLLTAGELSDDEVKAGLEGAKVDPDAKGRPSVETVLHALALRFEGVNYVGHTHPTAVNAILCSQKAEEAIAGRLFPDEIVYCGPAPVYVPYTDPGLPLARAVRDAIDEYLDQYQEAPKVILMQNHGLIALGKSASEVENITAMYVKTARVIVGAYALGGPHFMSAEAVSRIHTRPDELYRRQEWGSG